MATIQLPKEFKDFFQLLNNHGVEYLLIGGYAIAYYGFPRATGDIDIWVDIDSKNQDRLSAALKEFGLSLKNSSGQDLLREGEFIRIGNPPLRIDLVTKIAGVLFKECFQRRSEILFDDVEVSLISIEDLKKNKKEAGRHKDLNDLENLP